MDEQKAYELMKISNVVGRYLPYADYEDVWEMAKKIYNKWESAEDLSGSEVGYVQEYAERYMKEEYFNEDPIPYQLVWHSFMDGIKWNKSANDGKLGCSKHKIWTDGSELLVDDENIADIIADFIQSLGFDSHTGYYDPEEDRRDNCIDDHTGWYYVDID